MAFNKELAETFQQRVSKDFEFFYNQSPSNNKNLVYCKHSVLKSYRELCHDMDFISTRRLPNGVGRCKLAGIILWRLYKSNFARYTDDTTCNRINNKINPPFEIALLYVLKNVLAINPVQIRSKYKLEFQELEYQLRNRHINQESIALMFKIICRAEQTKDRNCCDK
jgi:hypothetical protein